MRGGGLRLWGVMRCGRGFCTTHYIVQPRLTILNGARNRLSDKGCHPFHEFPDDSAKICSFSVSAKNMLTEYTFYLFRILCFRLELRSHLVGKWDGSFLIDFLPTLTIKRLNGKSRLIFIFCITPAQSRQSSPLAELRRLLWVVSNRIRWQRCSLNWLHQQSEDR